MKTLSEFLEEFNRSEQKLDKGPLFVKNSDLEKEVLFINNRNGDYYEVEFIDITSNPIRIYLKNYSNLPT